ncbi:hypothetical protein V1511DRAFT_496248 [Dipodascopsis uninucleata]
MGKLPENHHSHSKDKSIDQGKGKEKADGDEVTQSIMSRIGTSTYEMLSSFQSPRALGAQLATTQASVEKGQASEQRSRHENSWNVSSERCWRADIGEIQSPQDGSPQRISSSIRQYADYTGTLTTERNFSSFMESHPSSLFSSVEDPFVHKPIVSDADGSDVARFLVSSNITELVDSPIPGQRRSFSRILEDIESVEDPVDYLLNTTTYTEDVWGPDWDRLRSAREKAKKGNVEDAREDVKLLLEKIKAHL